MNAIFKDFKHTGRTVIGRSDFTPDEIWVKLYQL